MAYTYRGVFNPKIQMVKSIRIRLANLAGQQIATGIQMRFR